MSLANYAASHRRVGGVIGVGMCLMDALAQLVRRGSHVKGLVALLRATFFLNNVGFSELSASIIAMAFTKGFL